MIKIGLLALSLLVISCDIYAISKGEYIARLGDCSACHTANNGKFLAGGVGFATPVGVVYSTNITPDKEYGIGNYTFWDFERAMRKGIAKDGHHLYPAMPYPAYAKIDDADMHALYDYLIKEVEGQHVANLALNWPLSMRWPMAIWNGLFHHNESYRPNEEQSAQWNRGAYLVQSLGHCGSCHTARGWAMQEKALNESQTQFLSGAELDGWYASNIRGLPKTELIDLLKKGRSHRSAIAGPMAEVVTQSTQYLTEDDLNSIALYLSSLEPPLLKQANRAPPTAMKRTGAKIYQQYCQSCHGARGEGIDNLIPALAGNSVLLAENPLTALRVILEGAATPITQSVTAQYMPGYAWELDDSQVAALMSYLRSSWGNQMSPITVKQVKKARALKSATQHN